MAHKAGKIALLGIFGMVITKRLGNVTIAVASFNYVII